jgi:hypothetical protein
MNQPFRVGAALLLKTLYKNVALFKYHLNVSTKLYFPSLEIEERQQIWSHNWRQQFGNFCKLSFMQCNYVADSPKGESSNRSKAVSEH